MKKVTVSQPQRPQLAHHHQYLAAPQPFATEDGIPMEVDEGALVVPPPAPQKRSLKRSFGATTMEILKSFPFPGHHHHHNSNQHQQHRSC